MREYERTLERTFGERAKGAAALFAEATVVFDEARIMRERLGASSLEDMRTTFPRALRAMAESWDSLARRHIADDEVRAVVAAPWSGYLGLPASRVNAAALALPWVSYHHYGAFYPRGGSAAVSRALASVVCKGGGAVRYRTRVARVIVEDRRAVAIELEGGERVGAGAIVSNASAPDTVLRLVGGEHYPAPYRARVARLRPSLSIASVYVGLEQDVSRSLPQQIFVDDGDVEKSHAATLAGDWEHVPFTITQFKGLDPDCAPDGCSVVKVSCLAPWHHGDVWGTNGDLRDYSENHRYIALKSQLRDRLLARAERFVPRLRESIRYEEVATPLTQARYSCNPEGAVYGSEQHVDGMYIRRTPAETPIRGLFMAGAWTFLGGGQSAAMLSGERAGTLAAAAA